MLILILGKTGSGKSFFTEHQLFPYVSGETVKVISEPSPAQLKANPVDFSSGHLVIEAISDKDVPADLRARADYVVFMTDNSMQEYFDRSSNDMGEIRSKRSYSLVKSICGVDYTPVVFDPNSKRFIIHYS